MTAIKTSLMQNQILYAVIVDVLSGIPGIDEEALNIQGLYSHPTSQYDSYSIYEWIGKYGFVSAVRFIEGSESQTKYGGKIIGVICYSPRERIQLDSGSPIDSNRLKYDILRPEMRHEEHHEAKYSGIHVADILSIQYLCMPDEIEFHDSQHKKVPNIHEIPFEGMEIDYVTLHLNFYGRQIGKYEFKTFEQEKFIAYYFIAHGIHNIAGLAAKIGYDDSQIKNSWRIWNIYYEILSQRSVLSEKDLDRKNKNQLSHMYALYQLATKHMKLPMQSDKRTPEQMKAIAKLVELGLKFEPKILLLGVMNIYWDEDSFIHILACHASDSIAEIARSKSLFPYKTSDIEDLIEGVLNKCSNEINAHFSSTPTIVFRREYAMAIEFNGDYFNFRIDANGRIETFYKVEPK